MNELLMPILAAAATIMMVIGIFRIARDFAGTERKRIKTRLSSDAPLQIGNTTLPSSIILDTEVDPFTRKLLRFSVMQDLYRKLLQAFPDMAFSRFLVIVTSAGIGGLLVTWVILDNLAVATVAGALCAYLPLLVVANKKNRRQRLMADQLRDALDFLARVLKAGHGMAPAMQMLADELPEPLAGEFRRAHEQHSLGQSMEDCMRQMILRIESTDFAYFATAVLIQRQTGGDLSEILNNISGMIRQRIRLQNHVRAKTAEGRFSGYILVAFPALMFVISYSLNPTQAGVLLHTETGMIVLAAAFVLQGLGLYFIRKITRVSV